MLFNIIVFFLIIFSLHHLYNYMKDNLSFKKKKFVNNEVEKYRQIIEEQSSYISMNNENTREKDSILDLEKDSILDLEKDSILDLENDLHLFLQNNI